MTTVRHASDVLLCLAVFVAAGLTAEPASTVTVKANLFPLSQVRLLPGPFNEAMVLNQKYLHDLEPDRMLLHIYEIAGLKPKSTAKYGGWSGTDLTGHYLSACSLMYLSTGDVELKRRIDYIVDELAGIQQQVGSGYIGAVKPASQLIKDLFTADKIRGDKWNVNGCGNFFYGEHSMFAGLIDACVHTGNQKALKVATDYADWYIKNMAQMSEENSQKMLATEHGGIMESMAHLYGLTGEKKYLDFALRFEHHRDLDPLAERRDEFTGLHANTTIPKIIGAARVYELTGDKRYRTIAEYFWDRVVETRLFAPGGVDFHEHFRKPGTEVECLNWDSTETCCVYNMLKLTRMLFTWDPQPKYMDYYEKALINHILGSQDPKTGGFTYFYSLQPGGFKVYGSRYDAMWCCVKTGLESQSKYGDTVYSHKDDALWVNLFIPSRLEWVDMGVVVQQETSFPEKGVMRFTFNMQTPREWTLHLRVPEWAGDGVKVLVNGKQEIVDGKPASYLTLRRKWNDGDAVEFHVPMTLRLRESRDNSDTVSIMYGPHVLAGALGTQGMPDPVINGNHKKLSNEMPGVVPTIVVASRDPNGWLEREPGDAIAFRTKDAAKPEDVPLIPIYRLHRQRQTAYWNVMTPKDWKALAPEPAKEVAETTLKPGLAYDYYEGEWSNLPNFAELKTKSTGVAANVTLTPEGLNRSSDNFALRFKGFLKIAVPGTYAFCTKSDDGSRILLGGRSILESDGIHAAVPRTGRAMHLEAGLYSLEVQYFEARNGEALEVLWHRSGVDARWTPIPPNVLFHRD